MLYCWIVGTVIRSLSGDTRVMRDQCKSVALDPGLYRYGEERMRNLIILIFVVAMLAPSKSFAAEFHFGPASAQLRNTDRSALLMTGEIVLGDYDRFVDAIRSAGTSFFGLQLRSGGGNVAEAIRIGRLARQLMMYVYLPFPAHLQNLPTSRNAIGNCAFDARIVGKPVPCGCASACTLIFFGGAFRVGWEVQIHRIAFPKEYFGSLSPQEADEKYKQGMDQIRSYLAEMGIDDKFYFMMLETPSDRIKTVSLSEAPQLFGWAPSLEEWLTAKCGTEMQDYKRGTNCRGDTYEQARHEALKRVLNVE
jgi:hypothetical protein